MYPFRRLNRLPKRPKYTKHHFCTEKGSIQLNKVLLVNKVSRLDIERMCNPDLSSQELERNIRKRGMDYDSLVRHHTVNKEFQDKVLYSLEKLGITVKNVNRFNCTAADVEWSDAVFPIGGDGTFLNAARYIRNRGKLIVGFNSDPSRSEGFLCLPKRYSTDISSAIRKLIDGEFKWMFRTRIRVTFDGGCDMCTATELHDVKLHNYKFLDNVKKKRITCLGKRNIDDKLPILALNEVFMSEIFAAKVSYFEMSLNNSHQSVKIKSSGLCICTGSGSTSWNLSINRLRRQDVHDILMLYISETKGKVNSDFENLVTNISNIFNKRIRFDPEDLKLGYTIRDLISLGVWPNPKGLVDSRGFAQTIQLKSRCLDAAIIVDGGISFPFNEGAVCQMKTYPEDSLRTVVLID